MARAERRRIVRTRRRAVLAAAATSNEVTLSIGPPPRSFSGGWPELEAGLLEAWNRRRGAIIEQMAPHRPFGFFWFDRPHVDTIPGPVRDGHLAAGRLTADEASMMERSHTWHAWAQIAASRRCQSMADWLADPALIDATIALLGWNPFAGDVIASLRDRYGVADPPVARFDPGDPGRAEHLRSVPVDPAEGDP